MKMTELIEANDDNTTGDLVDLTEYEQVYLMEDDDKSYVGRCKIIDQSGQYRGADQRKREHHRASENGEIRNCARLLSTAIAEKGIEAFVCKVLETVHTSKAAEREIYWINEYETVHPKGYNLVGGVDGKYQLHDETKMLMRISHMSFGKDAQKRYGISIERKITDTGVGYRGFHDGVPKGFFSNTLSEEDKKAKAIHYHLTGQHEYERRIPRARKLLGFDGQIITQPGVKPASSEKGNDTYRAYHPSRSGLKEKSFQPDEFDEAVAYAKELIALPNDMTQVPDKYKAVTRSKPNPLDKYLKTKSAKKDTQFVKKGEVYGYSVEVPKALVDPTATRLDMKTISYDVSPEENKRLARLVRNSIMKNPIV